MKSDMTAMLKINIDTNWMQSKEIPKIINFILLLKMLTCVLNFNKAFFLKKLINIVIN